MSELWVEQSSSSLPWLSGPLWPEMVAPDRALSIGQIELFDIQTECKKMTSAILNYLKLNNLIIWLCLSEWLMFNWIVSDT